MVNYGYGDLSGMFGDRYSTQAALNDAMLKEAMSVGQLSSYGMGQASTYYQAAGGGTPLGSMLTQSHPTMQRQNILAELQKKHPNPDTPEKLMALATDLSANNFGDLAMKVRKAANEARASMPKSTYTTVKVGDTDADGNRITTTWLYKDGQPFKELGSQATDAPTSSKSNAWKEYTDMTSNPTPEGFEIWYKKYKVNEDSKPTSYQEYALTTDDPSTAGYTEWMKDKQDDDDETNFILGDFRLAAYEDLKAKNPTMDEKELERQANVEGQKLFDEYETNLEIARSSGNFLDEIHTLQSIINPDTLEGKPLYDKKDPNGRTYTEAEAVEQAKQNVRLGADQVYDQLIDEHNLTQTSAYHTTSTESADTAKRNLRDLNEMLQLLEMGAKTGFSQDFKDKWRSAFESFGFTSKDLAVNEVLRTKMKKLALDRLSALKGAASDKDIEFVEAAGAQMNKSELANEVIIKIAKIYAQDEIDLFTKMNKWVSDYKSQNNRRYPSLDAYKIKEQELIDSKPHISERIGVTMKQLLAIEPDWEYTETAQDTLNNSMFLDALQEKYGT